MLFPRPHARLTVDLGAVATNYRYLQSQLKSGCQAAAVVKADAYGLGAQEITRTLFHAGCRFFYVATVDEALIVRATLDEQEAYDIPVAVFYGLMDKPDVYAQARLTPVLNRVDEAQIWADFQDKNPHCPRAILHVDTGINRLGLPMAEIDKVKSIPFSYIASHFACSDTPDHPQNTEQIRRFEETLTHFPAAQGSFANSCGIFLPQQPHYGQARPGCALYGVNPKPGQPNAMQPVAHLDVRVLQIRSLSPPETVGYGAEGVISAPTRLATLAFGYADGYHRQAQSRGKVYTQSGQALPVIGRVSMDLVTVDASHAPDLSEGDWVEVLGHQQSVDDVAEQMDTIGYEVLTSLGKRYQRLYTSSQGMTL